MSKGEQPKHHAAGADAGSVTISASLGAAEATALDNTMKRTQWHRSRVVANALDLYSGFEPETLHQLAALQERLGSERVREAVIESVARALDRLEWDALAEATAIELRGQLPEELTEKRLVQYAQVAIGASRAERGARPVGNVSERVKADWGEARPKRR